VTEETESIINSEIMKRISKLEEQQSRISDKERIADLEIKMSKLWDLFVSYTPTKQEKLSKAGQRFGSVLLQK